MAAARPHREKRSRAAAAVALGLLVACLAPGSGRAEPVRNGFDLAGASVPVEEILPGGPPRDGIPALEAPPVLSAAEADWPPETLVLGFAASGEARAYPVPLLDWHELVNDTVGGRPVLISWCPLCGSGMVFDRKVSSGSDRHFGVSGLLFRSDVLMYDRETGSLWSQISSQAISGPSRGQRLVLLRSRIESLAAWRQRHPSTTVLARATGHDRDYERSPYRGYATSPKLMFPLEVDARYHPKMPTVGLRLVDGAARAYPAVELVNAGGFAEERFEGRSVRIVYDDRAQVFDVEAPADVEVVESFWFAWAAFHPETSVFRVGLDTKEPGDPGIRPRDLQVTR